MCELLAIVVKFMLRSPILLSESTSENLTGAQGESPKFRSFIRRLSLYVGERIFCAHFWGRARVGAGGRRC